MPIEQRNNGKTGQRASREICRIERGDMRRLARKYHGELQSGYEEGEGRGQVNRGEPKEIRLRNIE